MYRRIPGPLTLLLGLVLCTEPAFAYRPFITEDAGVAGKGVLQAEVSYDEYHWRDGAHDRIFLFVAPIWGPSEDVELSAEIPYVTHKHATGLVGRGIGDINLVGKKVLLREGSENPLLTLKAQVKLDTGDYDHGTGRSDTEYTLSPVLSKSVTDALTLHAQAGYTWATRKQVPGMRNFAFYGVAADLALTEAMHLVAEHVWNQYPERGFADQRMNMLGLTWAMTQKIVFDVSYRRGIGPTSPSHGAGVGLAIEF